MPVDIYEENYKSIFEKYELFNIFLITPQTTENRIRQIDNVSNGFIYMVSSASVTGGSANEFDVNQKEYFERIANLNLKNPQVIGFGINNKSTFNQATKYAKGAIIGSAFIKNLTENGISSIDKFIKNII